MKKPSKLIVEYAVIEQPNNIENRSGANIDDGEYIRSHWQKRIIKHQPPIIRTMEDLKLLDKGKNNNNINVEALYLRSVAL